MNAGLDRAVELFVAVMADAFGNEPLTDEGTRIAVRALLVAGWRPPTKELDRPAVTIQLTESEANALYFWTQSHECPDYWTTPLDAVARALARWYREGSPPGWSNRPSDDD